MRKTFVAQALFPTNARDEAFRRSLWNAVQSNWPEISPRKLGFHEPLTQIDDTTLADRMFGSIPMTVYQQIWKPDKAGWLGTLQFDGGVSKHSSVFITGPLKKYDAERMRELLFALNSEYAIDYAFIHTVSDSELEDKKTVFRHALWPLACGMTTVSLGEGIADATYAMLFGRPYVELIGKSILMGAGNAKIESTDETVWIEYTGAISTLHTDYLRFRQWRNAIRSHVGPGIFYNPDCPDGSYRSPDFSTSTMRVRDY